MSSYAIQAEVRSKNEKVSYLRAEKRVPVIVYGKTQEPISASVDASDMLRLNRDAGKSNIISLKVGKKDLEVLIYDLQKDPVIWNITHVDFYAITRGEKLTAEIHIEFIWDSPAVKLGCIVQETLKTLTVKCRPRDLVDHFEVNLGLLKEDGDMIHISDLWLDMEKYEFDGHHDSDVIASASLPRAVVETEETEVVEAETPEETK